PADGSRTDPTTGLHFRSTNFQEVIQLIAGLDLGSTAAPHFAVDINQANFTRRFFSRPAADSGSAIDQRQSTIFLETDHHAIRQLNSLRLLWLEGAQRTNRNLPPIALPERHSRKN